jgi:hypothetical protein
MIRPTALAALLLAVAAHGQPPRPLIPSNEKLPPPKLEPVAEAKLLMEGLAKPNFDALGKLLTDKPADADGWTFARGQALLLAESGNLLMMRPPKARAAQDAWLLKAAELRTAATTLATAAGRKEYPAARAALAAVANACNRCHETFRVPTRVTPFDAD